MKLKSHIAILLAVIFFGKFLMLDAKILDSLFADTAITWVNPYCEKNKLKSSAEENKANFEEKSDLLVLAIDSFCSSVFDFKTLAWQMGKAEENFGEYDYLPLSLHSDFQEKFYPPPKFNLV